MHDTRSSQSAALQHVPQVAVFPSAEGQHESVPSQSAPAVHLPPSQRSLVQGSPSLHCESLQHVAHPCPGQHSLSAPQPLRTHWLSMQVSVVQGSPSSQSKSPVHRTRARQPSTAEQYWRSLHAPSLGTWTQTEFLQLSCVHATPSSQSLAEQHWPQTPPQHFWPLTHLASFRQVPSSVQRSTVHESESSQSACSAQPLRAPPVFSPPPLPTLPPDAAAEPPLPRPPPPPPLLPAPPPLLNSGPTQAPAKKRPSATQREGPRRRNEMTPRATRAASHEPIPPGDRCRVGIRSTHRSAHPSRSEAPAKASDTARTYRCCRTDCEL